MPHFLKNLINKVCGKESTTTKVTYADAATQTEDFRPERPRTYRPVKQRSLGSASLRHRGPPRNEEPSRSNSLRIPTGATTDIQDQLRARECKTAPRQSSFTGWYDTVGEDKALQIPKTRSLKRRSIHAIFEKEEEASATIYQGCT